ncbi:MAG: hypothetical protein IKN43_13295 [Selenomonadaceae bacterium]|nr:hypothetical protein [Selenomonadaceae bacterium]
MTTLTRSTQDLAMDMAKKFLINHMANHRACFKSPWPDEEGRYHIFQSHRIDDETLPMEFPNGKLYYREIGNGWAITVGY